MNRDPVTVRPDAGPDELHRLLVDQELRLVPVVEDGHLLGVVTGADLLRGTLCST